MTMQSGSNQPTSEQSTSEQSQLTSGWNFWIDRGGTFTDVVAQQPNGFISVHKLLSENPQAYEDAPIHAIRMLLEVPESEPLPAERITSIKMGTTVATNALLERKGDRTLFITTKGFRDALRIGYQNRPNIFALHIDLPEMLYERVVEVDERVDASGTVLREITPEVEKQLLDDLEKAVQEGISACAISFVHGYRFSGHEQRVAKLARKAGFTQVSTSHEVSPLVKWVSRSDTTVVDAYLSPILRRYVDRVERALGKDQALDSVISRGSVADAAVQLLFMQSNGGLTPARYFQGKDSILSGPAGGIVGAVQTSLRAGFEKIITFDMGGTSTDVSHFKHDSESQEGESGGLNYERSYETEVAGVRLRSPMMAIHTVAAGGGSVLTFDGERYQVGPDSAGAYPGPTCYRNGGPLTVTDCNVMVGKLQPQFFPRVFGVEGNQPLDKALVQEQFLALAEKVEKATGTKRSAEQVAEGFLAIAIDNMANAIKKISVQKGYDISDYALCCFGAAGGQHACRLAESLGMKTIFVHPYAGVLSAYGMGLANRRVIKERSVEQVLSAEALGELSMQIDELVEAATAELRAQGEADINRLDMVRQLHVRYEGTDSTLAVGVEERLDGLRIQQQFEAKYKQQYGITLSDKALVVSTLVAEAVGRTAVGQSIERDKAVGEECSISREDTVGEDTVGEDAVGEDAVEETVRVFSGDQWYDTPCFSRADLKPGVLILGPAVILEETGTTIVEPGWCATVDELDGLILRYEGVLAETDDVGEAISENQTKDQTKKQAESQPDPVRLEIFNSLFQTVAEQMGFTLQNTSSSVNIKERLDFSCAIFDGEGQLVANAPHIPVHLGSMGESVQALIDAYPDPFQPGDTFISNNPYNGGTHLPDITAITPVFISNCSSKGERLNRPLFFVASRGHHADIGGITPGSMPANSTSLEQEGVLLDNFKLVDGGQLRLQSLLEELMIAPYPVRNPEQNIADLQAQVAANNRGVQEIRSMVEQFGLSTVQAYMQHVQDNAERAVRRVVRQLYEQHGNATLSALVPMDCGAKIQVSILLSADSQAEKVATIDFMGTSSQQKNNFNAPLAVCKAAVLYVFRTLVDAPIPLNAGCLKPLEIVVPDGCMLSPNYPAAVVAGNVETSQAVTDALYGALGVLAASQGTMNNFTFGNERYQYYETICGGSGAGATFAGTDAVQTHMTNSRLTDPEVLEMRFPVLLESFSIRDDSGGKGQYNGGNGVVRRLRFCQQMSASLLSGRRQTAPFGLNGGESGKSGYTQVIDKAGNVQVLGATASVEVQPDDVIEILTPGGGGYGTPST